MDVEQSTTIAEKHGKVMYYLGLKHAIAMFELAGDNSLGKLHQELKKAKEEADE